jgi:hypothetical protein
LLILEIGSPFLPRSAWTEFLPFYVSHCHRDDRHAPPNPAFGCQNRVAQTFLPGLELRSVLILVPPVPSQAHPSPAETIASLCRLWNIQSLPLAPAVVRPSECCHGYCVPGRMCHELSTVLLLQGERPLYQKPPSSPGTCLCFFGCAPLHTEGVPAS